MDIVGFITSLNLFDLMVILFLFGMFVLGFIQGDDPAGGRDPVHHLLVLPRRAAVRAVRRVPRRELDELPHRVRVMIGFLTLFVAAVVAFFLVVQGTYQQDRSCSPATRSSTRSSAACWASCRACSCCCSSRSSWTSTSCTRRRPPRRPSCRSCGRSGRRSTRRASGGLLHETVIPSFLGLVGFLIPDYIKATYGL